MVCQHGFTVEDVLLECKALVANYEQTFNSCNTMLRTIPNLVANPPKEKITVEYISNYTHEISKELFQSVFQSLENFNLLVQLPENMKDVKLNLPTKPPPLKKFPTSGSSKLVQKAKAAIPVSKIPKVKKHVRVSTGFYAMIGLGAVGVVFLGLSAAAYLKRKS
jgi:hypothetical protein